MQPSWKIAAGSLGVATCIVLVAIFGHFTNILTTSPATPAAISLSTSHSTASPTASTSATTAAASTATKGAPKMASTSAAAVSSTTQQARELTASGGHLLTSIVNVVCLSNDPSIPSITGSGVVIDSRGIIVTAAHVAQLFLLADYLGPNKVQCLIRSGSPARRAYTAEPIFVSSSWIAANPSTLSMKSPVGTGQYDVALLAVTGTATSTPVPASLPYVPLATTVPTANEPVAIGSYAAQYLSSSDINYSLYPTLVFGSVFNRYTFDTNTVDEFSVMGTAASEEGSSGGGIVNSAGQLMGIITTSSINGSIGNRTLNAVTAYHLRQTYRKDTGNDLDSILANSSLSSLIDNFKAKASVLGAQLAQSIGS